MAVKNTKKSGEGKDPSTQEEQPKLIWTNDRSKIIQVLDTRESIQRIDSKGKLVGGVEFYGQPI